MAAPIMLLVDDHQLIRAGFRRFRHYKKRAVSIAAQKAQIQKSKEGNYLATYQGQTFPLISQDGGGLVASGGGNLVASGGGNLQVWSQN